ncbi:MULTISPECIES: ABC transporter substrate-binding protein [Cyanophyceae]|uniref:ABC transporter substrate-binding protein n=1 Tax=Cyanophyceae TaxID=3028117 RepID=UPI001685AD1E|nr:MULTISPECIES: ABC transporter substrate-binding protein [Cyanophyceae]MBD1915893.1 ABC transporter substrate-binding protein [Phormidium sp. FACHB-77]MBD2030433.1 ABC transporter substrate-binding protein [Phormidium sp. FACHB-322]MBD2053435.1 ABC transporter substrate-binding protein [Leptolyngbya sp. FACHB-60]
MQRRTFLPTLLAFFCSLLITVSCAQNTPQADAPADAPATATTGEPVKLGYSSWAGWWPWAIAEEEGLFEKNGANVELIWFDGYLESLQALAAGQLDANSQTLNDTISFAGDAVNGMVAVLVNDNSAGNDKVIGAEGIDTVADLAGKTVALEEGVVGDFLLSLALEDAGLTRDVVEIKNLETGSAATAFAAEQVDGFAGWVPFWETALSREGSKELVTSAEYPGAIPDLLVVAQKLIDSRPDQVQALVNTWFDILAFIEENPDRANEIMAKRASVSDTEFEKYTEGTKIFTLDDNLEAFSAGGDDMKYMPYASQVMADFMVELKFIPEAPDLEAILDDQFVKAYTAKK